ncbi:DnaJ homolog subfamily B member 11 [Strongyloides ratti]|uniref:DnaJ homolog dnj-20 n=1 Tax=Strongyloides ratti TaxID=34506 RepID=A0A090KPP4_STRRB|nr:DnaJ homolog subfamily B member 11 [Strongyloides ratti]CEF59543.1 DnaJ homolog subfamily B member 11 [Strongyloides ratti]
MFGLPKLSNICIFIILLLFILFTLIESGRDFYKILGVPKNANQNQIKKAYRKLAKELHPDRNQGDESSNEKFQDLGAAYEVLSDPKLRKIYDRSGEEGLNRQQQGGGGHDPFSSFFGDFFGGNEQEETVNKGADVNVDLWVTLDEVYNGAILNIKRVKSLYKETSGHRQCNCRYEMKTQNMGGGRFQMYQVKVCDQCPNVKLIQEDVDYNIEIERGVEEGTEILHSGDGEPHIEGEAGDLTFKVKIEKHPIFERKGMDLYTNVTISLEQALVGFTFDIKHMDGHKITISREKITWPGARIRKKDEGMPDPTDHTKYGILYITFDVDFPKGALSEEEKKQISEILKQQSFVAKEYNGLQGY